MLNLYINPYYPCKGSSSDMSEDNPAYKNFHRNFLYLVNEVGRDNRLRFFFISTLQKRNE